MVYVASSRPSKQGYYIVRPSLQKQNRGEGRRETGEGEREPMEEADSWVRGRKQEGWRNTCGDMGRRESV